jgi:hypothetical protein
MSSSGGENKDRAVVFARWVPAELQDAAREIVGELDPDEAQMVINEWAGCMAVELIDISPLGYLQAMNRKYQEGNFRLNLAKTIADIRAKQMGEEYQDVEFRRPCRFTRSIAAPCTTSVEIRRTEQEDQKF